jgi:hypothetical protein
MKTYEGRTVRCQIVAATVFLSVKEPFVANEGHEALWILGLVWTKCMREKSVQLLGIKSQLLGLPVRSIVTVSPELSNLWHWREKNGLGVWRCAGQGQIGRRIIFKLNYREIRFEVQAFVYSQTIYTLSVVDIIFRWKGWEFDQPRPVPTVVSVTP